MGSLGCRRWSLRNFSELGNDRAQYCNLPTQKREAVTRSVPIMDGMRRYSIVANDGIDRFESIPVTIWSNMITIRPASPAPANTVVNASPTWVMENPGPAGGAPPSATGTVMMNCMTTAKLKTSMNVVIMNTGSVKTPIMGSRTVMRAISPIVEPDKGGSCCNVRPCLFARRRGISRWYDSLIPIPKSVTAPHRIAEKYSVHRQLLVA